MMISVVMSVFSEPTKWLIESIESILSQTHSDLELIIIVDNPSINMEVLNCLNDYTKKDKRVRLVLNEQNIGLALSLNKGISLAQGDYIARMDADDISLSYRLEKELEFMLLSNADMVGSNGIIIDENSCFVRNMENRKINPAFELPYRNPIIHPSVLIKTSVVKRLNGYRNFRRSQDYDLWLRMVAAGYKIRVMNEVLIKYRISQSNLSNSNRLEQYYTHLFQRKLYFERLKNGSDSFSEEKLRKYLASKRITAKKNAKCKKCLDYLENAKSIKRYNPLFYFVVIRAFFAFPSITCRSLINNVTKKGYHSN